ncbi:DUF4253 domain-containing protein [Subtercola endophyticus]|uniref:DUF4253 domain-containing protein n=1 Tax=Subtercola endophyticus TaxID=2895559 RepID=UPI001E328E09|nr:DUF4253 domain-containing protein [Subtercola endophyticus]UFS57574.1 DUF4253 domain-containing protein [Subtercola endophyticus]
MKEQAYEPPPLTFAQPGEGWGQLAARYPQTGLWPVFFDERCDRDRPWGVHSHWGEEAPRSAAKTIREQFCLERQEWDIQEDDYCFECGVVRDRSGELCIGDEAQDLSILNDIDAYTPGAFAGGAFTGGSLRRDPLATDVCPALVEVKHPADCLAELGWTGAMNAGMLGADARVVLESWQRRFGAYVYSASDSRLSLMVTRPPTDIVQARLVAREHFHFCRYDSQFHGFGGIGPYVAELVGSNFWSFWWD